MKKTLSIVLTAIASLCGIVVLYLLFAGFDTSIAIPFTILGLACAMIAYSGPGRNKNRFAQ